jgi:hypothetical protein
VEGTGKDFLSTRVVFHIENKTTINFTTAKPPLNFNIWYSIHDMTESAAIAQLLALQEQPVYSIGA